MQRATTIRQPEKEIPLIMKVDIVVGGGGPAGFPAAIAAARNGANVLLVERYGFLGGAATAGLVFPWFGWTEKDVNRDVEGIYKELVERLLKLGGALLPTKSLLCTIDPEILKYVLNQMMEEAGVRLLLHSLIVDTIVEDNKIKGIIIENKSGRQAIVADAVIDATGDADIAAAAGVPFQKGRKIDGLAMPHSLIFRIGDVNIEKVNEYCRSHPEDLNPTYPPDEGVRFGKENFCFVCGLYSLIRKAEKDGFSFPVDMVGFVSTPRKGEVVVNFTRVQKCDATSAEDLTWAEIEARNQVMRAVDFLRRYVPGFESSYLIDTAVQIGIRESRRIIGEYVLTEEDVLQGRRFDDVVVRLFSGILDVHSPSEKGFRFTPVKKLPYEIPYRCFLAKNIEGLLVVGRCTSVSHEALGALRSQQICMAMGQAAGTAAALAIRKNISPRRINVPELQEILKQQGLYFGEE